MNISRPLRGSFPQGVCRRAMYLGTRKWACLRCPFSPPAEPLAQSLGAPGGFPASMRARSSRCAAGDPKEGRAVRVPQPRLRSSAMDWLKPWLYLKLAVPSRPFPYLFSFLHILCWFTYCLLISSLVVGFSRNPGIF